MAREDPPFSHPFLQTIIERVVFSGRPSMAEIDPDAFLVIRLETIAFACTLVRTQRYFNDPITYLL